jgi:hypothetical protein
MSKNRNVVPVNGTAQLWHMLTTARTIRSDLYESYYQIPVTSKAVSTERKVVERGQGPALKRFLEAPVHTFPDAAQPATRTLPHWMYQAIEGYIVQAGRHNYGYTLELVAIGEPWLRWVLQRLRGATMRFHQHGPIFPTTAPKKLKERAEQLQLVYWWHDIHFVMRMNAFPTKQAMDAWIPQHRSNQPIDRLGAQIALSDPPADAEGRPWFESMGNYTPHSSLALAPDAAAFAFRSLSNWQLFKAYVSRTHIFSPFVLFDFPLTVGRLHWEHKPGSLLVKFDCDLRLEIYA